ncbi:MAG: Hpt domain-containing protein [Bacteroidales bacterium]|nr:Hpt domain-containing protein [Bacteroidales bacterium]
MNDLQHFNKEKLLQIIGGDEDFVIVLVKTFFDNYEKYITKINEALAQTNQELLKLNAHSIKGSARSVFFEIMADYAGSIENLEIYKKKEIIEILDLMSKEFDFLKKELKVKIN